MSERGKIYKAKARFTHGFRHGERIIFVGYANSNTLGKFVAEDKDGPVGDGIQILDLLNEVEEIE